MPNDDERVVLFDTDTAEELLDLVDDTPGEADEDLLDSALDAVDSAGDGLAVDEQQRIAAGDAVAIEIDGEQVDAVTTLIQRNVETEPSALKRVRHRLKDKLRAAAKKQRKRRARR